MNRSNNKILGIVLAILFIGIFVGVYLFSEDSSLSRKRILFIAGDSQTEAIIKAADLLLLQYPELSKKVDIIARSPANTFADDAVPAAELLFIAPLYGEYFAQYEKYLRENSNNVITKQGIPDLKFAVGLNSLEHPETKIVELALKRDPKFDAYWKTSSPEQLKEMMVYALSRYLGIEDLKYKQPKEEIELGMGVLKNGKLSYVKTYEEWEQQTQPDSLKPKIAILVGGSEAQQGILTESYALIKSIEEAGAVPVFVFGYPASDALRDFLLDKNGNPTVDAIIARTLKFPDQKALEYLKKINVPVINAIRIFGPSIKEWDNSVKGLSSGEVAWQISIPELSGTIQPTVVSGTENSEGIVSDQVIPHGIDMAVKRAMRWIKLQRTTNADKKIAIVYWNYPPGKGNIGASYLNVMRSMPEIMRRLQKDGYKTDGFSSISQDQFEKTIINRGRNVGSFAPGELKQMAESKGLVTIPVSTYKKWLEETSPRFQQEVSNHWGEPEDSELMAIQKEGELHFVLPIVKFGNILLLPQPDRARSEDIQALYQSQELPPHHQYVAAYLWLQRNVDALIHTGTHGTLEWLGGKETGQGQHDAGQVLAGDLPILYPYIVDDVGEGITAKRRSAAVVVDHLTPALGLSGLSPELQKLKKLMDQYFQANSTDADAGKQIAQNVAKEVARQGIDKDLKIEGWSNDKIKSDSDIQAIQQYLEKVEQATIPLGLHTFGISPNGKRLEEFTTKMLDDRPDSLTQEYKSRLTASGPNELQAITKGLNGRYIEPAAGNDPILNPDALPTGRNFYTFDPRTIPSKEADETGKKLAGQLLDNHLIDNGAPLKKAALEVWGTETIRHMGVQESQGFALMGVQLIRNDRGRVTGMELIPREKLDRPRVDVVFFTTGLYRDNFPSFMELLDEAVQLAASSPEKDNNIRINAEKLYQKLRKNDVDSLEARRRSLIRVFSQPAGRYSSKISEITYASGTWDKESQVAETYINRMGNGYGGGFWGDSMKTEFESALSGTEAIVHTRASNLYATLDNDDYFSYGGSIALGVRHVDSTASPPFYVSDLRTKGEEKQVSLQEFMGEEMRSRYFNPKHAKELMSEGYAGGRHMLKATKYLWGWNVVYPEAVDDTKWQELYEVWVKDKYNLETSEFFEKSNPYALTAMTGRMLETSRKGYWDAPPEVLDDLTKKYVENIAKHGVNGDHITTDNPQLQEYIKGIAEANSNIAAADVTKWMRSLESATNKTLDESLKERVESLKEWHNPENQKAASENEKLQKELGKESKMAKMEQIQGYKMQEVTVTDNSMPTEQPQEFPWLIFVVIASLFGVMAAGAIRQS